MTEASTSEQDPFALLIIDPQVDFHEGGTLAVQGANVDAQRIHDFILANLDQITAIHVTLDSHQRMHISHGLFWINPDGQPPPPFTPITSKDVESGAWMAVRPDLRDYAKSYVKKLEESGRFQHFIWPEHCLIGSPGYSIVPKVLEAVHIWAGHSHKEINYHAKGINILTEMYSVFKAEVPVPSDPSTELNCAFVEKLANEPRIFICGQALSHCVNFSTRDLIDAWPQDRLSNLHLLHHMSSPVTGFETQAQVFIQYIQSKGVKILNNMSTYLRAS